MKAESYYSFSAFFILREQKLADISQYRAHNAKKMCSCFAEYKSFRNFAVELSNYKCIT